MTKPIIVVKMPCKLLYIIQVKRFLMVITSWPYLISKFLVTFDHLQWAALASHFFTARLLLFSIHSYIHMYVPRIFNTHLTACWDL